MNIICQKCGNQLNENAAVCPVCGTYTALRTNDQKGNSDNSGNIPYNKMPERPYNFADHGDTRQTDNNVPVRPQQPYNNVPVQPQQPYNNVPVQPQQPYNGIPTQPQQSYGNIPVQSQQAYYTPQSPHPAHIAAKGTAKSRGTAPKSKKKRRLPWILRFIIANLIIAGILLGAWYAFGNIITLGAHSNKVVETLNSGSLDLPGMNNAYNELPNYVKDMLGEEHRNSGEYGPMTKAILPHITVEKVKVNGFFGSSSVEYKITAPDIENWLLELDPASVTSADVLLSMMEEYIKTAPTRSANVTVEYTRDGFFSIEWYGNYYTREFSDAVCGGFNSAYNELYQKAMDEIMDSLYGTQEVQQ